MQQDIQSLTTPEDDIERRHRDGPGKGHRTLSWIWITVGMDKSDTPEMHKGMQCTVLQVVEAAHDPIALRVEWARSCARMQQWGEEVQLLQEEMHQVLAFFEYQAAWWDSRGTSRTDTCFLDLRDGVRAYAAKQAAIYRNRRIEFASMWSSPSTPDIPGLDSAGEEGLEDG
ncbi:hypothetical protein BS47DRAFT_1305001 [Hydnum rufescens UP504]|uniref:Uncharacterized protein n=1 Tax=Hydnum rufescens UP504 TaxID=1448309 RepID=A0A9P6DM81_9AGAM|nr:hypothetical protein BS47DRAFT_1305001 [Hydnum rufescens UP504]